MTIQELSASTQMMLLEDEDLRPIYEEWVAAIVVQFAERRRVSSTADELARHRAFRLAAKLHEKMNPVVGEAA